MNLFTKQKQTRRLRELTYGYQGWGKGIVREFGSDIYTRGSEVKVHAMRETRVRSLGRDHPLEKEMATHSRILAWRTPWTEKPGGLQSMGSQRVGHDWATSLTYLLNQQGPTVYHRPCCSILCNNLNGEIIWKGIDTYICVTESLYCIPEMDTILLINQTPM